MIHSSTRRIYWYHHVLHSYYTNKIYATTAAIRILATFLREKTTRTAVYTYIYIVYTLSVFVCFFD